MAVVDFSRLSNVANPYLLNIDIFLVNLELHLFWCTGVPHATWGVLSQTGNVPEAVVEGKAVRDEQ